MFSSFFPKFTKILFPVFKGFYAPSTGLTSPSACAAGYFSSVGAVTCSECPSGSFSVYGATACSLCSAGSYSGRGYYYCPSCPSGYFSLSNASSCSPCPAGSFNSYYGASSCSLCPAGSVSGEGSGYCNTCYYGVYAPVAGLSSCLACPAGTFRSYCNPSCSASTSCAVVPSSEFIVISCLFYVVDSIFVVLVSGYYSLGDLSYAYSYYCWYARASGAVNCIYGLWKNTLIVEIILFDQHVVVLSSDSNPCPMGKFRQSGVCVNIPAGTPLCLYSPSGCLILLVDGMQDSSSR